MAAHLAADASVAAIVGVRVYQLKLPQNATLPAVRVQLIDAIETYHLRGGSLTERSRVQVDAFAKEASGLDPYATVEPLADAIHAALSGIVFDGDDIRITGSLRVSRQPLYEPDELRDVRMTQDYIVWSKRAA